MQQDERHNLDRRDLIKASVALAAGSAAGVTGEAIAGVPADTGPAQASDHGKIEYLLKQRFDYVVVGAGAAGSALAASLTDDASCSVLLIEAGRYFGRVDQYPELLQRTDKYSFTLAPGQSYPATPDYGRYTWSFEGHFNRYLQANIVRGRVVGGSSAVNGASFTRGRPYDYDRWAAMGNTEWSFEKVLPAFRAIETDLDFGETELHGARGPMPLHRTPVNDLSTASRVFIEAAMSAGFPWEEDLNGLATGGVGVSPVNSIGAVRQNAGAAFLARVVARPNLHLLSETQVRRVVVEKGVAMGVEVALEGRVVTLRGEETILCAGGLNSPHLLMLSGLGPEAKLRKAGVEVVADLPCVGANLSDHPYVVLPFSVPAGRIPPTAGRGAGVMLHYASAGDLNEDSRILPYAMPRSVTADGAAILSFHCSLGSALSRGELQLRTGAPEDAPIIQYNYLSEPDDLRRMRECVRRTAHILQQPAYRAFGAQLTEVDSALLRDSAALDRWMQTHLNTAYHSAGTCKMGPDSDETAVVDQYGRVRGVGALRVADISIMPKLMTRGAHATAVMIGEHMARLIRRQSTNTRS